MTQPQQPQNYPQNNGQPQYQQQPYQQPPKKPWYKRLGCIIPLAIVAVMILFVGGCMALFGKAASDVSTEMDKEHTITYSVEGDAQDALVTYNTGETNTAQDNGVAAGWTKDVTVKGFFGGYMSATNGINDQGTITCKVTANGKTVSENTASGPGASASCNASADDIKKAFE